MKRADRQALALYRAITDATDDAAVDAVNLASVTLEQVARFRAVGWIARPAPTVRRPNVNRLTAAGRAALEHAEQLAARRVHAGGAS